MPTGDGRLWEIAAGPRLAPATWEKEMPWTLKFSNWASSEPVQPDTDRSPQWHLDKKKQEQHKAQKTPDFWCVTDRRGGRR